MIYYLDAPKYGINNVAFQCFDCKRCLVGARPNAVLPYCHNMWQTVKDSKRG